MSKSKDSRHFEDKKIRGEVIVIRETSRSEVTEYCS